MIKIITGTGKKLSVENIMNEVNDYILFDNNASSETEKLADIDSLFNEYNRIWNEAASMHEIKVKRPIMGVGVFRKIKIFIKKCLRKVFAWWLDDIMFQQSQFNLKMVEALNENKYLLDRLEKGHKENKYLLDKLEKENKLLREERAELIKQKEREAKFSNKWYLEFENVFRGSQEIICDRYQKYLHFFIEKNKVVDLGCGRGELLKMLKKHRVNAIGVDSNHLMVLEAQKKGLTVIEQDVTEYLETLADEDVDGFFAGQLVEHFTLGKRQEMLELAYKKLSKDGVLIIETVNPLTLGIFCYGFYIDPTHSVPVHPAGLRFMAEQVGFEVEPVGFSDEFGEEYKFQITDDMSEGTKMGFQKLNAQLFGAQDYYLICRKR